MLPGGERKGVVIIRENDMFYKLIYRTMVLTGNAIMVYIKLIVHQCNRYCECYEKTPITKACIHIRILTFYAKKT